MFGGSVGGPLDFRRKAYLVIDPTGLMQAQATVDPLRAHEYARNTGSVVVELPIIADYRAKVRRVSAEQERETP